MFAAVAVFAMSAQAQPNMEKYNKSCVVCHDQGVAGAPKTGDAAAWEPRVAKGMDALMASVKNGLNAMPPMGMCFDCSDDEYMALIKYMSTPAE
jgi:cytochrome c5